MDKNHIRMGDLAFLLVGNNEERKLRELLNEAGAVPQYSLEKVAPWWPVPKALAVDALVLLLDRAISQGPRQRV